MAEKLSLEERRERLGADIRAAQATLAAERGAWAGMGDLLAALNHDFEEARKRQGERATLVRFDALERRLAEAKTRIAAGPAGGAGRAPEQGPRPRHRGRGLPCA